MGICSMSPDRYRLLVALAARWRIRASTVTRRLWWALSISVVGGALSTSDIDGIGGQALAITLSYMPSGVLVLQSKGCVVPR